MCISIYTVSIHVRLTHQQAQYDEQQIIHDKECILNVTFGGAGCIVSLSAYLLICPICVLYMVTWQGRPMVRMLQVSIESRESKGSLNQCQPLHGYTWSESNPIGSRPERCRGQAQRDAMVHQAANQFLFGGIGLIPCIECKVDTTFHLLHEVFWNIDTDTCCAVIDNDSMPHVHIMFLRLLLLHRFAFEFEPWTRFRDRLRHALWHLTDRMEGRDK